MIIRARAVVTMDGGPIENGAVRIDGGKIAAVGEWNDLRRDAAGGEIADLGECALLPGLINAHCHLDYTNMRGSIPRTASFTSWVEEINQRKVALTPDDYLSAIATGFEEAASLGTTTIGNLEAFPELFARMSAPPLRTWWFAELIDVRERVSPSAVLDSMTARAHANEWQAGFGFAPHAPFTASARLYAEVAKLGRENDVLLTTHLAESRDEMEMFRDARGALFDFMKSIGRPMDDCRGTTPLSLLLRTDVLDERWIIAHLNELTGQDLALLERAPRFHIVHCPRSHAYFGHSRFRFAELRALGFNICLGTDSLASNEDLSLFAEMRAFSEAEPSLSPRELLQMVTVNAAAALGQHEALGKIRAGSAADLIAVPWHGRASGLFDDLLSYNEKVSWLMVGGAARMPQ